MAGKGIASPVAAGSVTGNRDAERVVFMDWEFTDLGLVGVQCLPL